jgi:hypothetical protein
MHLTHLAGIVSGCALFWWRYASNKKVLEPDRTWVLFGAALSVYVHALALLRSLL